ncbi:hypothetical protein [Gimesia maris]|uniref:hypothetical protein n=1 Tax=Gimesia maris TaxID=122 RepID=UPI00241C32CA|nr:hypothetical protein [Gimesia maris]
MGIDRKYQIEISYSLVGSGPNSLLLKASDFFDYLDYKNEEWSFDLPWQRLTLEDYIQLDLEGRVNLSGPA